MLKYLAYLIYSGRGHGRYWNLILFKQIHFLKMDSLEKIQNNINLQLIELVVEEHHWRDGEEGRTVSFTKKEKKKYVSTQEKVEWNQISM